MADAALLTVDDLTIRFGGLAALSHVSFHVDSGEIVGLIGPNGAGKTTCFNCITRLYQPDAGKVLYKGDDLLKLAPYAIANKRIARTFQNLELFASMTALENVRVGLHARARQAQCAKELLAYVGQAAAADRPVGALPFGARKMVELARALALEPELLLLDEPASGFGHEEVQHVGATIARIKRDFNTTILMVEHQMQLVMRTCDRIVVLDSGTKLAEGTCTEVAANPAVIDAYLGAG